MLVSRARTVVFHDHIARSVFIYRILHSPMNSSIYSVTSAEWFHSAAPGSPGRPRRNGAAAATARHQPEQPSKERPDPDALGRSRGSRSGR